VKSVSEYGGATQHFSTHVSVIHEIRAVSKKCAYEFRYSIKHGAS